MKFTSLRAALRTRLESGGTIIAPGVHDPVAALLAEKAGFEALYIGSYATAAARLGMPDVGMLTMEEMVAQAQAVANAVNIPVLADAEDGWNNAASIWRTIRAFEQAGICGVHIEDHAFGKHAPVPQKVAPLDEMLHKVRAALDAREDPNFLVIARTDVIWTHGDIEEGIHRLNAFTEAGADVVMAAGVNPRTLREIRGRLKGKVLITDKPGFSVADEQTSGADIVIYYGLSLLAAYSGVQAALETLKSSGAADGITGYRDKIAEFEDFIGYPAFTERAKRYGLA